MELVMLLCCFGIGGCFIAFGKLCDSTVLFTIGVVIIFFSFGIKI